MATRSLATRSLGALSDWEGLDPARLPRHVAVIMDGNRRWAKERKLPAFKGHREGVESLRELVKACRELGIPYLTVYAFSTENWQRSPEEVSFIWHLFEEALMREVKKLHANDVQLRCIGAIEALAPHLQKAIARAQDLTAANQSLVLQVAINYGSRQEILEATRQAMAAAIRGELAPEDLTEQTLRSFFYAPRTPDPDLLIRTSGEHRLSNYLLWQLAYTEIHVTPTYWPAFSRQDLRIALLDYQRRERRFGATPS